jgi:hypothetical protein
MNCPPRLFNTCFCLTKNLFWGSITNQPAFRVHCTENTNNNDIKFKEAVKNWNTAEPMLAYAYRSSRPCKKIWCDSFFKNLSPLSENTTGYLLIGLGWRCRTWTPCELSTSAVLRGRDPPVPSANRYSDRQVTFFYLLQPYLHRNIYMWHPPFSKMRRYSPATTRSVSSQYV